MALLAVATRCRVCRNADSIRVAKIAFVVFPVVALLLLALVWAGVQLF